VHRAITLQPTFEALPSKAWHDGYQEILPGGAQPGCLPGWRWFRADPCQSRFTGTVIGQVLAVIIKNRTINLAKTATVIVYSGLLNWHQNHGCGIRGIGRQWFAGTSNHGPGAETEYE